MFSIAGWWEDRVVGDAVSNNGIVPSSVTDCREERVVCDAVSDDGVTPLSIADWQWRRAATCAILGDGVATSPSPSLASSSTMSPCLRLLPFGGGGDPSSALSLMMVSYLRTPTGRREKSSSFSSMMATFLRPLPAMMKGTESTAEVAVSKLTAVGAATQGGPVPSRTLWDMTQGGRRAALCYLCSTGVNLVDF